MNCENCQHGGTIVPKPKIKVVQGNVLRLAIPLTLRTIMKDGDEIEYQDTDFIPSSEHPVLVVFGKGKTNIPVIATMDGNLAIVEERGKLPVGTYNITVECFDDAGQPYRFKKDMAVQVVDTTAEAGIEETIEYEAQTWYLDSAIYLATTEIGSLSEEIDRRVSDLFGYADYDATNKAIRFYDKSKTQVLTTLDATPFLADGMVENVYIDVDRQVLVVVLNAEAGSRMFTVPLYLIFANYYTKTQIDNRLSSMETFNFDTYVAKQSLFARDNNVSTEKMPHLVLYSMGRPYDYVSEIGIGQPYFANGYISIRTNSLQTMTIGQPSTRVVYCNAATNKLYRWNGTEFVLAGLDENVIFGAFVSGKFMRFTYNTETREWENTSLRVVETPYAIYVEVIENKTFRFDTKDGFVLVGDGSSGGGGSLEQVQADWNQSDSSMVDYIKNKPNLATVATSGSYNDLSNKPTIPAAQVQSDWNATSGMGAILNKPSIPSKTSDLTNDSGFINRALYYGECTTAAATMPKVCTVETFPTTTSGNVTHAKEGTVIAVKFTNSDTNTTDAPTLNVNGIGAKAIMYNNAIVTSTAKNTTVAGTAKVIAYYRYDPDLDGGDGAWEYMGKNVDSNTTYSTMSQAEITAGTSTTARTITPKLLRDNFYTEDEVDAALANKANKNGDRNENFHAGQFIVADFDSTDGYISVAAVAEDEDTLSLSMADSVNGTNVVVKFPIDGVYHVLAFRDDLDDYVPQTRTINGKALSSDITLNASDVGAQSVINDLATIRSGAAAGATALQPSDVSVETPATPDGTVDINVGSDTYTINLNHTHENMAKIVKCTEATKPATMDNDTIYVQVDNATTPTEIECLYLFGLEFSGGGVPDTGQPLISRPADGTTISLGKNTGSGVSKNITIKGKNLTGDLTVTVGTGLSLTYGQSTGSSVTIPLADALLGAQVTVAYNTFGGLTDGSLIISHGNDVLSAVTVVVEALLPSAYTQLEYISNAVRGIDTGILATDSEDLTTSVAGSSWEVDVQCDSTPTVSQFVVACNEDVGHWFGVSKNSNVFGAGTGAQLPLPITTRQFIQVTFMSNKITATCNGTTVTRNYTYPNKYNVCLFANVNPGDQQYAGRQYTGRIYSAKCVSGGSFNGIPAKRNSDNHFGLYDIENNVFYDLSVSA